MNRDTLSLAQALEHAAMLIVHMDEQGMRSAIIWHQTHQEQVTSLLAAAKGLRAKHDAELRDAFEKSQPPMNSERKE